MSHRLTFRDRVAAHFRARPHAWIPHRVFLRLGGACAWRTRISDCRTDLGMRIDNAVVDRRRRQADGTTALVCRISFYRFVPPPSLPLTEERNGQLSFGGLL